MLARICIALIMFGLFVLQAMAFGQIALSWINQTY
jgi:hypothetical protein